MRPVVGSLLALALAACAGTEPVQVGPPAPATTGQALAQLACPHRIAEAYAWVNHMPGPSRPARTLNVTVKFTEATDTAVILKSPASTGDVLILEIRTAPAAPAPGQVSYRDQVPDPLPKKVSFFCRGGEIFALNKIQLVY